MEEATIAVPSFSSLKKQISQLYNKVNQEMYGIGVKKQRIEIFQNSVIIFSEHKRVPALNVISNKYPELTISTDAALVSEFKQRIKDQIENSFQEKVLTVLKDFDPKTEQAFTVIQFEKVISPN
ncbi:Na-translocating system protein MpsC family protein [Alteribacter populi]|uniref:Na-translocating system protein MpsC family protein n=1 Tax=Alteribacter populi TaxID=2011011 RepID=UPI000BBB5315|nr:Na-translocating system protein MpsC family protein [Alteribacter populi]